MNTSAGGTSSFEPTACTPWCTIYNQLRPSSWIAGNEVRVRTRGNHCRREPPMRCTAPPPPPIASVANTVVLVETLPSLCGQNIYFKEAAFHCQANLLFFFKFYVSGTSGRRVEIGLREKKRNSLRLSIPTKACAGISLEPPHTHTQLRIKTCHRIDMP